MFHIHFTGAFLFPYIILMVLCGIPLYFLEIAMSQFSGKGPWKFWDICPLFRGIQKKLLSLITYVSNTFIVTQAFFPGRAIKSLLHVCSTENGTTF